MNGKYVVKEIKIEKRYSKELEEARKVIIGYEKDGIVYPSPLSDFIEKRYFNKSTSISHQKNPAYTVVQFMNYLMGKVEEGEEKYKTLKEKGLFGIELFHGEEFLTYLTEEKEVSLETFDIKKAYLTQFYVFLSKQKIIENIEIEKRMFVGKETYVAPFENAIHPKKNGEQKLIKKKDLVTHKNGNRVQMVREFILMAHKIEPSIAFGIALLFYAGLRLGECVNLMKSSVKIQGEKFYGEDGIVLEVRDNQKELFKRIVNSTTIEVKKPRDQVVLMDQIIPWLYKEHMNYLDKLEKKGIIKNEKALFINEKTGEAITGKTFRDRFENVKQKYLEELANTKGRLQDYQDLKQTKWSTHIGRGTFTNMIVAAGFTVEQTAIARGDSNINSALQYTDTMATLSNVRNAISMLVEVEKEDIEMDSIAKTWKEVVHFGKVK